MVLLNLLFQNFDPKDEEKETYKDLGNLLQSCIKEVKEIAYNLLPPELEKGFINAMERFAHRINSIGEIEFQFNKQEDIHEVDLNAIDKFNLYRIIQELFNNSLKHSNAEVFSVDIEKKEDGNIEITIMDNGDGFDADTVEHGLGLTNIHYRISRSGINGDFVSEKGKGTRVNLIIN